MRKIYERYVQGNGDAVATVAVVALVGTALIGWAIGDGGEALFYGVGMAVILAGLVLGGVISIKR